MTAMDRHRYLELRKCQDDGMMLDRTEVRELFDFIEGPIRDMLESFMPRRGLPSDGLAELIEIIEE